MSTLYNRFKRVFNVSLLKPCVFALGLACCSVSLASGYQPSMLATEIVSVFGYDYREPSRSNVFSGHTVLCIVPHEDDESCLMGGIFEEYVQNGSTVNVAFMTNGDYSSKDNSSIRAAESIAALETCGITSEHVYFLGYGDQWKNEHIYHAKGNKVLKSHVGESKTYGSDKNHSIYHEGNDYTRNNLKSDIRSLIEELHPDTIFCIDFDGHQDHRALSLLFEEVMGEMLHDDGSYRPIVFKGFGYSLAWHAKQDFYQDNIFSCRNPYETGYMQENNYYSWNNRVRFPVSKASLSRLKSGSSLYKMLTCYPTQLAAGQAGGIINGDRVFWYRNTSSLLYQAKIQVSSGKGALLTDFRIIDAEDVTKVNCVLTGHVWSPSDKDPDKMITVTFPEATDLTELRFYDNPDITSNVLNLKVTFSDGSTLETGELSKNGAATSVSFNKKTGITGFTVAIASREGKDAGLCEIEAYNGARDNGVHLIKLMNASEDFVYDYWLEEDGEESFYIYEYPAITTEDLSTAYTLEYAETDGCSAYFESNRLEILCEQGRSFDLIIRSIADPSVYDSVRISNPSHARRLLMRLMQHVEHASGI